MSEEQNDNEHIYSDWLEGKISDEEFERAEGTNGLSIMKAVVQESDQWNLPPAKTSYSDFKSRITSNGSLRVTSKNENAAQTQSNEGNMSDSDKGKGKVISITRIFSIAAAVVLSFGFMFYYYQYVLNVEKYETLAGEIKEFTLPDETKVILNGSSMLSYQKSGWTEHREVNVEGQAYFEVIKKGPFKVNMEENAVNVLGTSFDVFCKGNIHVVKCFEGKVGVDIGDQKFELTPGKELIFNGSVEQGTFEEKTPTWAGDYTKFDNSQLIEVLEALSLRYNFEFTYDSEKINVKQKYSGQFINHDANLALEMVFKPLGMEYVKKDRKVQLKVKK